MGSEGICGNKLPWFGGNWSVMCLDFELHFYA